MKKILIPIITAASLAATASPLLSSCGNSGWISWDFTKGEYKKHKVTPLAYSAAVDPVDEAFKWFSEDKNNIVYDLFNTTNSVLSQKATINKFSAKFKINSFDLTTHAVSFESIIDLDFTQYEEEEKTTRIFNVNLDIVAKNIFLNIYQNGEALTWDLSTPVHYWNQEESKDFLASDESGDWSITGSYDYYNETKFDNGGGFIEKYSDDNCNYNKTTLDAVFDDVHIKNCLIDTYNVLDHPLYYLNEYKGK